MLQKNRSRDIGPRGDSGRQIAKQTRGRNDDGQGPGSKKIDKPGNSQLRKVSDGNLRDRGIRELQ